MSKKQQPPKMVERTSLSIDEVSPNPWNPNVQDAEIFRVLAQSLSEEGFGEPVLVRKVTGQPKPYEIVNGEHRYRLALETGMTHLPVAIVDMDVANAKLATLRRNRTRGGLDTIKTAQLLRDMRKRLSIEEIEQRLGYSEADQADLLGMLGAPFVAGGGKGGFTSGEEYELSVPVETGKQLDEMIVAIAGKKATRFEGLKGRKKRGMARALDLLEAHYAGS